jgi:hypothetical protein
LHRPLCCSTDSLRKFTLPVSVPTQLQLHDPILCNVVCCGIV